MPDGLLEAVRRFEPTQAGLPDVRGKDAAAYIDIHLGERPWLAAARDCSADVRRLFVALDQGGGHGHIRHEGWVTEEMNERRVAYLEDPAQCDPEKRIAGIDGLKEATNRTGADKRRPGSSIPAPSQWLSPEASSTRGYALPWKCRLILTTSRVRCNCQSENS